jgi:hypothetical protein
MVSVMDPYGRILGAATFSFKYLLNCSHKAEWTLFQTHYFSESLVALGIEHIPIEETIIDVGKVM